MFVPHFLAIHMLVSKDFVAYMAREIVKKLVAAQMIEAKELQVVTERVHGALLEELSLEDRINDEVRIILETYSDEMRKIIEALLLHDVRLDQAAEMKIESQKKTILEGSQEWEILYRKYYNEEV